MWPQKTGATENKGQRCYCQMISVWWPRFTKDHQAVLTQQTVITATYFFGKHSAGGFQFSHHSSLLSNWGFWSRWATSMCRGHQSHRWAEREAGSILESLSSELGAVIKWTSVCLLWVVRRMSSMCDDKWDRILGSHKGETRHHLQCQFSWQQAQRFELPQTKSALPAFPAADYARMTAVLDFGPRDVSLDQWSTCL